MRIVLLSSLLISVALSGCTIGNCSTVINAHVLIPGYYADVILSDLESVVNETDEKIWAINQLKADGVLWRDLKVHNLPLPNDEANVFWIRYTLGPFQETLNDTFGPDYEGFSFRAGGGVEAEFAANRSDEFVETEFRHLLFRLTELSEEEKSELVEDFVESRREHGSRPPRASFYLWDHPVKPDFAHFVGTSGANDGLVYQLPTPNDRWNQASHRPTISQGDWTFTLEVDAIDAFVLPGGQTLTTTIAANDWVTFYALAPAGLTVEESRKHLESTIHETGLPTLNLSPAQILAETSGLTCASTAPSEFDPGIYGLPRYEDGIDGWKPVE